MQKEIINGILHIDGKSTLELAYEFGTPLYVFSERAILKQIEELKKNFLNKYEDVKVAYAAKAFCTAGIFKICQREGLGIDVVSGGELYTALKANFPAKDIEFNGNNKTKEELTLAVENNIGRIIVDNAYELFLLEEICKDQGKENKIKILFRINPGVDVDTHDHIVTGKRDGKFGMDLEGDGFISLVNRALRSEYLDFMGLHMHIGSQLFDEKAYLEANDIMLKTLDEIYKKLGFVAREINLGGGFGVNYTNEKRKGFSYYLDPMMEKINDYYIEKNLARPTIVIEPGRSIVAEAGLTLYEIGSIKNIDGIRTYMAVDGGMSDNIRPSLYGAKYTGLIANRADELPDTEVRLVGKFCESGDVLIDSIKVPKTTKAKDIFAMFSTGAYGYSMASNYNKSPIPAVVIIKDGKSELMVKRQSYEQIIENEIGIDQVEFAKMHGAGNDFIIINNIEEKLSLGQLSQLAKKLCHRKFSVGADGFMAVEKAEKGGDFKMLFFNRDGSQAEMCGNGVRCIARYGVEKNLLGKSTKENIQIETTAGMIEAQRIDDKRYKVKLNDLSRINLNNSLEINGVKYDYLYGEMGQPGLPHAVVLIDDQMFLDQEALKKLGQEIRHNKAFEKGANVNFCNISSKDEIRIETYERGVEDLTLACGTGAGTTVALLNMKGYLKSTEVKVHTKGGELRVILKQKKDSKKEIGPEIYLVGPTTYVFGGKIQIT